MKPALKYGLIAAAWIIYLLIALLGGSDDSETAPKAENAAAQEVITTCIEPETNTSEEIDSSISTVIEETTVEADEFCVCKNSLTIFSLGETTEWRRY